VNKQEFTELLTNPSKLSSSSIPLLEDVIKNFPYCQAAHIFLARAAQQSGSMLAEQKVKKAAAYTLDRQKLKTFIFDNGAPSPPQLPELAVAEVMPPIKPETETKVNISNEKREAAIEPEPDKKEDSPKNTNVSPKEEFYKELEENLKKLHELKKDILKPTPQESPKLPAPQTEEPQLPKLPLFRPKSLPNPLPESEPEKIEFKYENPSTALNENIISDRFEDQEVLSKNGLMPDSELFLNYLSYLDGKHQKRDRKKEEEIIEKFIKEDPSIPYLTAETPVAKPEDLSEKSTKITKNPVSENFAKILLLQGKRDKALEIYEELILKYPEKRAYFTSKIEELKK